MSALLSTKVDRKIWLQSAPFIKQTYHQVGSTGQIPHCVSLPCKYLDEQSSMCILVSRHALMKRRRERMEPYIQRQLDGASYFLHTHKLYKPLLLPWGGLSMVRQSYPCSSVVKCHSPGVSVAWGSLPQDPSRGLTSNLLQLELPSRRPIDLTFWTYEIHKF